MATRGIISSTDIRFSQKGSDLSSPTFNPDDLVFKPDAFQGAEWKRGVTPSVGKNSNYDIPLGKNFEGWPLVFVLKLTSGSADAAGKAQFPNDNWVAFHRPGSNKVTIRNEGKPAVFAYLIMDVKVV